MIVSDMRMPNMSGAEFLKQACDISPLTMRILLTGYADIDAVAKAVNDAKIYNYLNKPWEDGMLENVINSALDFKKKEQHRILTERELAEKRQELEMLNLSLEGKVSERTQELEKAMAKIQGNNKRISANFKESLALITNVIGMQDGSASDYNEMVVTTSVAIAHDLGLSPKEIEQIRIAAQLHNIGKLSLPENIRKKSFAQLSKIEFDLFKKHSIQGEAILAGMTGLKAVSRIVRSHQEYIDGSGFPDKKRNNVIPIGSRIICVVSDFQKLISGLLVQDINSNVDAIEYIKSNAGKLYDARAVDMFIIYYEKNLTEYHGRIVNLCLEDVEDGMILAHDLLSETGILLLTKDSSLSNENINQLHKYESDMGSQLILPIINQNIDSQSQAAL